VLGSALSTLLLAGLLPGTGLAAEPIGLDGPTASWGPLRTLVTDRERIDTMHVVVLPDGTSTVVWVERSEVDDPPSDSSDRVMAVDVTSDSVSTPVVLGGVPGSSIDSANDFEDDQDPEAGGLHVGLDRVGNITLTWSERRDLGGEETWGPHVLSVDRPIGGEWTAPVRLTRGGAGRGEWPKLAVGVGGAAVVAWEPLRGRGLTARFRPAGGDWQAPVGLEQHQRYWSIAIDAAGIAMLLGKQEGLASVRRLLDAGTRWTPARTFGMPIIGPLDLAVNGRGDAAAVWHRHFGQPHGEGFAGVDSNRRPADGRWQGATSIPPTTRFDSMHPLVVLDGRGRATATWVQGRDDRVQVVRSTRSGTWRRTETLATGAYPSWHRSNVLAGHRSGSALVAWTVSKGTALPSRRRVRIDAAYRPGQGPWLQLPLASPETAAPAGSTDVSAAVRRQGGAVVVWVTARRHRLMFRELLAPR